MTQRISNLEALEVSLVPKGANKKKFILLKSDDGGDNEMKKEFLEKLMKSDLKDEAKIDKLLKEDENELSDDEKESIKGALRLLGTVNKGRSESILAKLFGKVDKTGHEDEEEKRKKEEEDKKKELEKAGHDDEEEDLDKKVKKNADGSLDLSGVPKGQRAALAALWKDKQASEKKVEALTKSLEKETDARITKEFNEKAAEYKNVTHKSLGSVLKDLHNADPKLCEKVEEILKTADKQLTENDVLLREIGSNSDYMAGADEMVQLEKMAAGLVQKASGELSNAQAFTKVLDTEAGKRLYDAYEKRRMN